MKLKVYAIARKVRKTYGHGDFGDELVIPQFDAYHKEGHFKPMYKDKEAAVKAIDNIVSCDDFIVVEMEII